LHWYNDIQAYFYQSKVKRDPLVRTEYTTPDDVFDVITYNKGGKILHMLRTILGDDAFFKSLSHYLKKHAYKTAEYSDFRKACEEVTGLDLEWFFNQWYLKGGHPIITTEWKQNGNEVMLYLSQKHNFDSTFTYRIPMDLDMYAENNIIRKNIVLEKSKDTFVFVLNEKVKAVNFDASNVLVAQKKDKKTTEENIYLLKHTPNYLDQYYAIQRLKEEVQKEEVLAAIFEALDSKKSEIQTTALQLLDKEHFEKLNQLENKLVTIANGKKNSEARAAAILKLEEANRIKNHISLIENCLKDSSYIVEAAAIKGLNSIDSTRALDLAKNRLESKNTDLRFAAIEIVSNTNDTNYLNYFKNNLETKRGTDKILAGIGFSKMIANTDAQNWTKSIQFLDTFFENPKNRKMYLANYIANGIITKLDKNKSELSANRKLEIQKKYLVWTKSNKSNNVDEENEDAEE
jgi:aminopeptidase N